MNVSLAETQISPGVGAVGGGGRRERGRVTAAALGLDEEQQCKRESDKEIAPVFRSIFQAAAVICSTEGSGGQATATFQPRSLRSTTGPLFPSLEDTG